MNAVTADDFMALGFAITGDKRWRSYKEKVNLTNFRSEFGVNPKTCVDIWTDLINENDDLAPTTGPKLLLLGLRWLRVYETERHLRPKFDMHEKTIRNHRRAITLKIQKLLKKKV